MNYWLMRACGLVAVVAAVIASIAGPSCAASEVRFDFETGDLQGWRIVDGEFGKIVSDRAAFHNEARPYNKQGVYFLSTLEGPDDASVDRFTGEILSPVFVLTGPEISLLVGGGGHENTYIALCDEDGREVAWARGENREEMRRVTWSVPELVGRRVYLRVVDGHTGGWGHITLDDVRAAGRVDAEATERLFAAVDQRRARADFEARLSALNLPGLRAAIADLMQTFPEAYASGPAYLARLDALEGAARDGDAGALEALSELRREALTRNPLVSGQPILFVVRRQYKPDHHNTETFFQTGEINTASFEGGGALKRLDLSGDVARVTTLLEAPEGIVRDPDVHFDGERVVFSMRRTIEDDYSIYEMSLDGGAPRQLTRAAGVTDIDPFYLPDDAIAFSSTREPKYCMCNRHIMANLYRMDPDGANIHQIGKSTLFEGHGSLLPDGRIIYYRWEYVDRNFGDAQGLWTVNPDGTNHAVYWGNNTPAPGGVLDPRWIPGTQQVIGVFGSCHDRPWGALAIVDRRLGLDGRAAVVRMWPESALALVKDPGPDVGYAFDDFLKVRPRYEDPYPLSDKYFLCARTIGAGEEMGLFLIDVFGNEMLLHYEEPGCFDPMPVGPRPRPPEIPSRRDHENDVGWFYVADVYHGTHMDGVERGAVKYLRVVESPEKRFWTHTYWDGQGIHCPAMNWHDFNNKRILGTVPVEEDGSAYFAVPSDTFVYFQLLDENGMMVQSMRSGTMVQSGERTGCVGCHEERRGAPPLALSSSLEALKRPPSALDGWYGDPRLFSFMAEVQPVFDRHCVECHDFGTEGGAKLLLAGDRAMTFNASYIELWRSGKTGAIGAGPAEIQQPYTWGSHASRLIEVLRAGHQDVKLSPEEMDRLVTWVDINAPYYPEYASVFPHHLTGRAPLNPEQVRRLTELTGVPFAQRAGHATNRGPEVSFDRPESSPCLAVFEDKDDPRYREALEIIRAGARQLRERPSAEHPGFALDGADAARDDKYRARREIERRNRAAIVAGERVYDP